MKKIRQIFGTGGIPTEKLNDAIFAACDAGYRIIDTAWLYRNEKDVAKSVKEYNEKNKTDIKIITKVQPDFNGNFTKQLNSQLKEMGLKKIYGVLLHRPDFDFKKSVLAWKELVEAKKQGKVEVIGVSNFDRDMLMILHAESGEWPAINQIEISVANQREDRIQFCKKFNIDIQAWRPTGPDGIAAKIAEVQEIAKELKVDPHLVAISYLIHRGITPVVRSSSKEHIQNNAKAVDVKLNSVQMDKLSKANMFLTRSSETFDHPYAKDIYYKFLEPKNLKNNKLGN